MKKSVRDTFVEDGLPSAERQPEFLFALPELQYPEKLNAAVELLASAPADATAVVNDEGAWSYGALDRLSGQIATILCDRLDLVAGNRVLLVGPNSMKLFAAWLGVLKAGGVVVATMPMLRAAEIAKILTKAKCTHAIVHEDCGKAVGEAARGANIELRMLAFGPDGASCELLEQTFEVSPATPCEMSSDDPALIAFTSGTTGVPKGCVQFHRDVLASADSFARNILRPRPGMRWASTAPLAFTFGLGMQFVFPLRFGGTVVTLSQPGPTGLLEAIDRHRINVCATAPTAYRAMMSDLAGHDLSSLEICVSAGEHLPEATWHEWKALTGLSLVDGIGATEMMHVFISASGDDIRPGSTGRAVPGYIATVLDEDGRPQDVGTGRLAIKGPTGCRYLDDPRQQDYVVNGWNVTGDTFRKDKDGYFWYVARSDDLIVSSGYNIAGPEVEEALYSHPSVGECAVVGAPCERRGNKVKAFVVLKPGCEGDERLCKELQDHVKHTIAPYKYPREIAFVESLPKTATGKLKRFELRTGQ